MTPITISLPEERLKALRERAVRLGVPAEALIRASIDELLSEPDSTLEAAMHRVIEKNDELYRRLA